MGPRLKSILVYYLLLSILHHNFSTSEEELLASARHSLAESADLESMESETSLESSLTTVSSWHESSTDSLTSEMETKTLDQEDSTIKSDVTNEEGQFPKFEGQPDLISEVGLSSSQQPDLVSSQEISRSCTERDFQQTDAGGPPTQKKFNKKKRTTHKDIKSRVNAMISKGKLKLSDSVGKKKRKNFLTDGVDGTFKKTMEENTEIAEKDNEVEVKRENMSEMKRNLTAMLIDEQTENINENLTETDEVKKVQETKNNESVVSTQNVSDKEKSCHLQDMITEPVAGLLQTGDTGTSEPKESDISIRVSDSANNNTKDATNGYIDDLFGSNENIQQLQRRYSTRKRWNKAQRPDVQSLLSKEALSVADSLEGATYISSFSSSDYIEGEEELEPEIIEEIRINKIKWKQVVAQIKNQCSSNQGFSRSSAEENKTDSSFGDPLLEFPQNAQVVRALETEFDTSRLAVSPKPQRKRNIVDDVDENNVSEEISDPSPNNSKDSDDYFVIASPEKETTETRTEKEVKTEMSNVNDDDDYLVIANPDNTQITEKGQTKSQPNGQNDADVKKSKASKTLPFGLSPLINKAKDKIGGAGRSPFSKSKVDTEDKMKKETNSTHEHKSSGLLGEKRSTIKKVGKLRKQAKEDTEKQKQMLYTNSNLSCEGHDRNTKDLATELAEATESNLQNKKSICHSPEFKKSKQRKKKSPVGSKTADLIRKDHESVMQILASRTLVRLYDQFKVRDI